MLQSGHLCFGKARTVRYSLCIFFALQASKGDLISLASGGGQPNLNADKLREDVFFRARPFPAQRAVADFSGSTDGAAGCSGCRERTVAGTDTGGETPRAHHSRCHGRIESRIAAQTFRRPLAGPNPSTLAGKSQLKRKGIVVDCKHRTVPFVTDGVTLASIREVQSWEVDLSNAKKTTEEEYELMSRRPARARKPGDVIVSRNATLGAAALVPTGQKLCMGQDVSLIRPGPELNPSFLNWLFRSTFLESQIETASIGSTFFRINVETKSRNY